MAVSSWIVDRWVQRRRRGFGSTTSTGSALCCSRDAEKERSTEIEMWHMWVCCAKKLRSRIDGSSFELGERWQSDGLGFENPRDLSQPGDSLILWF